FLGNMGQNFFHGHGFQFVGHVIATVDGVLVTNTLLDVNFPVGCFEGHALATFLATIVVAFLGIFLDFGLSTRYLSTALVFVAVLGLSCGFVVLLLGGLKKAVLGHHQILG